MTTDTRGFGCLLAVLLLFANIEDVCAQSGGKGTLRTVDSYVTVLLVDDIPDSAGAVIVRKADRGGSFVLIDGTSTAADLDKAMSILIASLNNKSGPQTREMRAVVTRVSPDAAVATVSRKDRQRAIKDLQRISRSSSVDVPGVGSGKAILVTVKTKAY